MVIESVKRDSSASLFDALKKKNLTKTVDYKKVDRKLGQRIAEFKSLDRKETAYKVGSAFLSAVLLVGWVPAYLSWKKGRQFEWKKQERLEEALQQLEKDTNRQFVITLNGIQHTDPRSLKNHLDKLGLSDVQKYTILQLSHQGIFATMLHAMGYDLIDWAHRNAPLTQEEGEPSRWRQDKTGTPKEYLPIVQDITQTTGKRIGIVAEPGKRLILTSMRQAVSTYDDVLLKPPYQSRSVLEFETSCTIDLDREKMKVSARLDQINPLDSVPPPQPEKEEPKKITTPDGTAQEGS